MKLLRKSLSISFNKQKISSVGRNCPRGVQLPPYLLTLPWLPGPYAPAPWSRHPNECHPAGDMERPQPAGPVVARPLLRCSDRHIPGRMGDCPNLPSSPYPGPHPYPERAD